MLKLFDSGKICFTRAFPCMWFFFPFFLFQIIKCVLLCRKDMVHLKHDELRLFPYPRMDITKAFKPERALFNNDECLIE